MRTVRSSLTSSEIAGGGVGVGGVTLILDVDGFVLFSSLFGVCILL